MSALHRLRPGTPVVEHSDRMTQVGAVAPALVVTRTTTASRSLLDQLRAGVAHPPTGDTALLWRQLEERDLVVPADAPLGLALLHGSDAERRSRLRQGRHVAVLGSVDLYRVVAPLLRAEGATDVSHHLDTDDLPACEVAVVLADGPLARDRCDRLLREDVPHLVCSLTPRGWVIGPFVVPGRTPCLRCLDATTGNTTAAGREPLPTTSSGQILALSWTAREVLAWLDDDRPLSLGATITLGRDPEPHVEHWPLHPHCGCSWFRQARESPVGIP